MTPNIPESIQPLQQLLINNAMQNLNAKVPLAGYEAQGLQGINNAYNLIGKNFTNRLTAQGLGGSNLGASAQLGSEMARAGTIGNFEASLPLLQEQYRQQNLMNAMNMYSAVPKGYTTTGSYTTPGNMLGGAFSGAGSMLGMMYGNGQLGGSSGTPTPPGGWSIPGANAGIPDYSGAVPSSVPPLGSTQMSMGDLLQSYYGNQMNPYQNLLLPGTKYS
jgi:hypothetical protein